MRRKRFRPRMVVTSLLGSLSLLFIVFTTSVMAAQNHNSSRSNAPGEGYGPAGKAINAEVSKSEKQGDPDANRYDFGRDEDAGKAENIRPIKSSGQQQQNPLYKAPANKKTNPMFEE